MENTDPIIKSFLDLDWYKLTMGQFVWRHHRDVPVTYTFINRKKDLKHPLTIIPEAELRKELDAARNLKISSPELEYLRESEYIRKGFFEDRFLHFLWTLDLPPYTLKRVNDTYEITVSGKWSEAIWWETIILSIVNELYYRALLEKEGKALAEYWLVGERLLNKKIGILKQYPEIKFMDFGTRRRFSRAWHENVLRHTMFELPNQLLGTSNVDLARRLNLKPGGTIAHAPFMAYAALMGKDSKSLVASQKALLENWWQEYGDEGSIALTDTYGSPFFLNEFGSLVLPKWRGTRQDSGDPFEYGERILAKYEELGIDAKKKILVFSDGLDLETMIRLHQQFSSRINVVFGWGTNLTNDLGLPALSIVMKLSRVGNRSTVKLSDNLAKAMGDPEEIERYKEAFEYSGKFQEQCKY